MEHCDHEIPLPCFGAFPADIKLKNERRGTYQKLIYVQNTCSTHRQITVLSLLLIHARNFSVYRHAFPLKIEAGCKNESGSITILYHHWLIPNIFSPNRLLTTTALFFEKLRPV
jgi:hypothetical protein